MNKPKTPKLEATAYHEAGHAFVAVERRLPFKYVTIEETDDSLGHILGKPLGGWFRPDINDDRRTKQRLEDKLHMLLAGGVAECLRTGRRNRVGASQDYKQAVDVGGYLHGDLDVLSKYLDFVDVYLRSWLSPVVGWEYSPWVRLSCIANALLEHKTLTSTAVRRLLQGHGAQAVA
jgi:hypothetical protein